MSHLMRIDPQQRRTTHRTHRPLEATSPPKTRSTPHTRSRHAVDSFEAAPKSKTRAFVPGKGIGSGEPSIDLNGTKYTAVEGRAKDNKISIHNLKSRKDFDPLKVGPSASPE